MSLYILYRREIVAGRQAKGFGVLHIGMESPSVPFTSGPFKGSGRMIHSKGNRRLGALGAQNTFELG